VRSAHHRVPVARLEGVLDAFYIVSRVAAYGGVLDGRGRGSMLACWGLLQLGGKHFSFSC
jgi:hypothetical protein